MCTHLCVCVCVCVCVHVCSQVAGDALEGKLTGVEAVACIPSLFYLNPLIDDEDLAQLYKFSYLTICSLASHVKIGVASHSDLQDCLHDVYNIQRLPHLQSLDA